MMQSRIITNHGVTEAQLEHVFLDPAANTVEALLPLLQLEGWKNLKAAAASLSNQALHRPVASSYRIEEGGVAEEP